MLKVKILDTCVLHGPNRIADRTLIEQRLHGTFVAEKTVRDDDITDQIMSVLEELGLSCGHDTPEAFIARQEAAPANLFQDIVYAYVWMAMFFQREGEHLIDWQQIVFHGDGTQAWIGFEYDEESIGLEASDLSRSILELLTLQGRQVLSFEPSEQVPQKSALKDRVADFLKRAKSIALPGDTQVLIEIARERGIPYAKGDRFPFVALNTLRIRQNAGLCLGFGQNRLVLDGTLCLNHSVGAMSLWNHPHRLRHFLQGIGAPLAEIDLDTEHCNTFLRARRCARKLGYPVSLKIAGQALRHTAQIVRSDLELETAYRDRSFFGDSILVEKVIPGGMTHLVFVSNRLLAAIPCRQQDISAPNGDMDETELDLPHLEYAQMAGRIARELGIGLFTLTVVSLNLSAPPRSGQAIVLDLCIAPELDRLIGNETVRLDILRAYMAWLYPPEQTGSIPIVAVTGTNGKTTTSRMINDILVETGAITGLACSDGVYLAGERVRQGDSSGFLYHHQVLQDSRVTHAVLETARGAALHTGLAYDACDIAVCTNVSDDHLEEFGIDTLEDMAAVKLYILKRARRGVVLNADDPFARSMRKALGGIRLGVGSLSENRAGLEDWREPGIDLLYGVVEQVAGQENLVLYDGDTRFPVIAINQIPATYRGTARHNVSNALQATLACYLMGVPIEKIQRALSLYRAGFDNAPGRLNLIRESPFTVYLDYAHNADGYRSLSEFIRAQSCTGKKILLLALPGRTRLAAASAVVANIVGCCDLYVCRDPNDLQKFQPGELPEYLRSELMRHGIAAEAVAVMTDEETSVHYLMSRATPGDLLILCVSRAFREKAYQIVSGYVSSPGCL